MLDVLDQEDEDAAVIAKKEESTSEIAHLKCTMCLLTILSIRAKVVPCSLFTFTIQNFGIYWVNHQILVCNRNVEENFHSVQKHFTYPIGK